jgi:hypothetical protein
MSQQFKPSEITFTPGDITDELIELATDEVNANIGRGQLAPPEFVAASILNAAVEVGLVVRNVHQPFTELEIEFIQAMAGLRKKEVENDQA